MQRLRGWMMRLIGVFTQTRQDRELADELDSHLQMHVDDNLRAGMTPQDARRHAVMKLGGVQPVRQAYRDRSSIPLIEHVVRDGRFAIRQLRKTPGFTATAIFMLALGLCASVAIFAFVDATLIKPLPYQQPSRLVGVFEKISTIPYSNLSYPDYVDWKKLNTAFSSLDAYNRTGFMLSTPAGVQPLRGARVTDGFFRTLGVTPLLGRDFRAGEDQPSAPAVVILSYAAWQGRYAGNPEILGQTITLDNTPATIIGVLPREFHFAPAEPAEIWSSLHAVGSCDLRRSCHSLFGVARLKDGVGFEAALSDVTSVAQRLEKQYPDSNLGQGAALLPLSEVIVGDLRSILLMLLSGAVLLLVIASVNVASLLLVRSEGRRREIAIRNALGASGARLISQFVTEGLVLVAGGTILGLVAAYWAMRLLTGLIPAMMLAQMSYLRDLGLNGRVLTFAGLVALLAAMLFSLTPMLRMSRVEMREGLAEGSRGSAGNTWRRLGSRLVVLELATAVVLLVGAGLLGKSLYQLLHVNIGFRPDHIATLDIVAPQSRYATNPQQVALEEQIERRIASLPGVQSVGVTTTLPLTHNGNTTWFRIVGRPWHGEHNDTPEREVTPDYFKTLGATLVRGRYFTDTDGGPNRPPVIIVNQAMARQYFPGENALGKQISGLSDPLVPTEIVGIVEDVREGPLDVTIPPVIYTPFKQNADRFFSLVVRTTQAEESVLATMAAAAKEIEPDLVALAGRTMNDRLNTSNSAYLHRSSAWLVGGFAGVAFLLSVIGLYGVVAYSVSQRRREIGVRMALGAHRGSVYRLILREAGWLTAIGIAIGLVCAVGAASLMRGFLFAVQSWDVPTLAAVAAVLGAAGLLASYIPARRAASVNPVDALRAE
jgi:macrolide transport system ATP-binding/permease protein